MLQFRGPAQPQAFAQLWLDGEKLNVEEYWQRDLMEFNLDEVRKGTRFPLGLQI